MGINGNYLNGKKTFDYSVNIKWTKVLSVFGKVNSEKLQNQPHSGWQFKKRNLDSKVCTQVRLFW